MNFPSPLFLRIWPGDAGHALIDASLGLAGSAPLVEISADPLAFPRPVARAAMALVEAALSRRGSTASGENDSPSRRRRKRKPSSTGSVPPGESATRRRQRLLLSLAAWPDRFEVELAYSSVDPAELSPQEIDRLLEDLADLLARLAPRGAAPGFVHGQN